jgi:hypothetical protein
MKSSRQEFLRRYIDEHGPKSCRKMADIARHFGFEASPETINKDFKAIGLKARGKGGRPRRSDHQQPLFLFDVAKQVPAEEQELIEDTQRRLEQKRAARFKKERIIVTT